MQEFIEFLTLNDSIESQERRNILYHIWNTRLDVYIVSLLLSDIIVFTTRFGYLG